MKLQVDEMVSAHNKLNYDPDHWFEINLVNAVLFDNFNSTFAAANFSEEILTGRLFTCRMPRDLNTSNENKNNFVLKIKQYSINCILILTESSEFIKYAGTDLERFYVNLGLEVIHRPIPDFLIPKQPDMIRNIKDLLWRLAEGKNCLVHCAGGNGRTGMVVAALVKNLGM